MNLKFISLASGSSGNCFYLGMSSYGILIDSGIGIRMVRKILRERGIAIESIMGIFVTHDHADHVRSVGNLSEQFNIPVYATEMVHGCIKIINSRGQECLFYGIMCYSSLLDCDCQCG